jgi:endonuclease YncB( thermonuclease family)/methylphosphotriester-DNA--protein-cysteine methyltransferase
VKSKLQAALFLAFVLACASVGAAQQANNVQLVIEGKVVRVADGDTITVLDADNKQHRIRFQGIDAPESHQAWGQASKENLSKMVFGKQVTVIWDKVDKYRRTVGKVLLDGRDVNIEQIKAGLAWHYKKYAEEQPAEDRVTYAKAEEEARAAKLGLWQDPNPTPPGEYRAEAKAERWGPPPPEGTIIGNKSSKKYHRPDCPGYRDMAERNRVFFKTVEEAEAAGYRRAGNCPAEVSAVPTAKVAPVAYSPQEAPQAEKPKTTPTPKPAAGAVDTATTGEVVGNKNSKIYHNPGCPGYKSVSEKNRVFFKTAAEAEAAGYKRAKNCKAGDSQPSEDAAETSSPTPSSAAAEKAQKAKEGKPVAPAETTTDAAETPAASGEIIGNKNSKIYHRPDCPGYKSVSEKNQVRFKSVAEAEAAGFRAAKNCPAQPTQ